MRGLYIESNGKIYASIETSMDMFSHLLITQYDILDSAAYNQFNVPKNSYLELINTVFRTSSDHITALQSGSYTDIINSNAWGSFIFASDLSKYKACYSRPAVGYVTPIT